MAAPRHHYHINWASSNAAVATIGEHRLGHRISAAPRRSGHPSGASPAPAARLPSRRRRATRTLPIRTHRDPISEGGKWINGRAWLAEIGQMFRTTPGLAFGTEPDTVDYDDSTSISLVFGARIRWPRRRFTQSTKIPTSSKKWNSGCVPPFPRIALRATSSTFAARLTVRNTYRLSGGMDLLATLHYSIPDKDQVCITAMSLQQLRPGHTLHLH